MRTLLLTLVALVSSLCLLVPGATGQTLPDGVEVDADTIERVDPDSGELLWRVVHPSIWNSTAREERDTELTELVWSSGRIYYGVRSWLIELNPETGVIEKRHWFPSTIVDVQAQDDAMAVTVEVMRELGTGAHRVTFAFEPGTSSPQEVWNLLGMIAVWKDASYLAQAILPADDDAYSAEERRAAIATLREHRPQEPSNPFYDFFIGRLYDVLGEEDRAEAAYERAVETQAAHWSTYVQLTAYLDSRGRHGFADRAFEKARQLIESGPHVHVRRSPSLVTWALTLGWSRDTLEEAVENENFERVDAIHRRTAWTFPYLEHSATAWRIVGDWYGEHGRDELAAKWHQQAERAEQSPWRPLYNVFRTADLSLALTVGLGLSIWLAIFIIGVRRARPDEPRGWLPRPTGPEILGVVAVLIAPAALLWVQQACATQIKTAAKAPLEVLNDGWSSPNTHEWLESLHASEARDQLIEKSKAIAAATRVGKFEGIEVPEIPVVVDAIAAHARTEAWHKMTDSFRLDVLGDLEVPDPSKLIPGWAAGVAFFLLLGGFVGSRWPRLGRLLQYATPGGARSASWLTPLMLGVFVTAIGGLAFGLDTILEQISQPAFGRYYGISSLYTEERIAPSNLRNWIALGVVLVLHGATLWWDRRKEGGRS